MSLVSNVSSLASIENEKIVISHFITLVLSGKSNPHMSELKDRQKRENSREIEN